MQGNPLWRKDTSSLQAVSSEVEQQNQFVIRSGEIVDTLGDLVGSEGMRVCFVLDQHTMLHSMVRYVEVHLIAALIKDW